MRVASVDGAFKELLRRIEPDPIRVALASQRYNALEPFIEEALPGKRLHTVGAFQRRTKIRTADLSEQLDIEALISFGPFSQSSAPDKEGFIPSRVLQIVRLALQPNDGWRVAPQENGKPTLRLEYSDQIAIELRPAFEDHEQQYGSDRPNCYVVGRSLFTWIPADYDYDTRTIAELDAKTEKKLIPTIKLIKAFFRNASIPLNSFHTEILVANTLPRLVSEWKAFTVGYQHLFAGCLNEISKIVTGAAVLRGSLSPPVDSAVGHTALSSIATFLSRCSGTAWQLCKTNSVEHWHEFFGRPFPAGASKGAFL